MTDKYGLKAWIDFVGADYIDSIEVIMLIDSLTDEIENDLFDNDEDREGCIAALAAVTALAEEAAGYAPDWTWGATLISDDRFEVFARELAEDIGVVRHNPTWPYGHVDWTAAAEELKADYTEIEFAGKRYWVR